MQAPMTTKTVTPPKRANRRQGEPARQRENDHYVDYFRVDLPAGHSARSRAAMAEWRREGGGW